MVSESTKKLIENLPEDYTPLPKGTWVQDSVEVDSEEFDRRQEVVDGMLKWFKSRLSVKTAYSYPSAHFELQDMIRETELCGENGEFPWEVMK